jgi:arylsulfatase A-like enzyme
MIVRLTHPSSEIPLMRPSALIVAVLLAAGFAHAAPPNILFIFSDDHAYQAISAYGHKVRGESLNQTPHIDRLAREGMLFRNCFVTNSICGPMRAVVQTGKYSHANGFYDNSSRARFDGSQQTFPKLLQAAGYVTAVIGKWHLGSDPVGFDYWHILPGQGLYYNPPMSDNGKNIVHTGYTTDIISDLSLKWLKEGRDKSKPFLLMMQHKAPHREWSPGPKHLDLFDDRTMPEPDTLFDDYAGFGRAVREQDMTIAKTMTRFDLKLDGGPKNLNPEQKARWDAAYAAENEAYAKANLSGADDVRWKYQRYIKDYLRCIQSVDDSVGAVLDYLDQSGLAQNTLVVYTSDQGFYLGEHGWFDKRWIFDESAKTPLLIRWPGVTRPGSVNTDLVSTIDFAPTFLQAAGLPVPADIHGRAMTDVLKGQTPSDWRKTLYYHYYENPGPHNVARHYGVIDITGYKLFRCYMLGQQPLDEWALIDKTKDPRELKNFYADPAYADVRRRLESELARHRRQLNVPDQDPAVTFPNPDAGKNKKKAKAKAQ